MRWPGLTRNKLSENIVNHAAIIQQQSSTSPLHNSDFSNILAYINWQARVQNLSPESKESNQKGQWHLDFIWNLKVHPSHRLKNSIITVKMTQSLRHCFALIQSEIKPQTSGPSVRDNAFFKTMWVVKISSGLPIAYLYYLHCIEHSKPKILRLVCLYCICR